MDHGKLKSLAHWVNSVGVGNCVESLQQLQDGAHFISIVKIINGDSGTQFCDQPVQRFRLITSFLQEFYRISLERHLDPTKILLHADISELAKVAALLLCAAIQGPKLEFFVDAITKLDISVQTHLKEIIEAIVARGSGNQLHTNFDRVLYKKLNEEVSTSSPMEPCTPIMTSCKTPLSAGFSPVKALFSTPNMVSKIKDRQMHEKIRMLESSVAREKSLRQDLEAEIIEKNSAIVERDVKVKELAQRVSNMRSLVGKVDTMQSSHDQLQACQLQVARLEKRLAEMEPIRSENKILVCQVERLVNENNELQAKMRDYQALKEKSNHRKSIATESQMNLREYQDKFLQMKKEKELMVAALKEQEVELAQLKEIGAERQDMIKELEEKLQQQPGGETLNIVPERQLAEMNAELQTLKETWIQPTMHQQVENQLQAAVENMKQMKETFQRVQAEYKERLTTEGNAARQRFEEMETSALCKVNNLQQNLQIQTDKNISIEEKLREHAQQINVFLEVKNHLTQDISSARTEISQQSEAIAFLQEAKSTREEELKSANTQIAKFKEVIEELQESNEVLRAEEKRLTGEVASACVLMKQQEEIIGGLNERKQCLEDKVLDAQTNAKQQAEFIATLQASQAELEGEVKSSYEKIKRYEEVIQEVEQRNNGLKMEERRLSEEIESAQLLANQQKEALSSLNEEKRHLQDKVSSAQTEAKQQAATLLNLSAAKAALEEEALSANAQIKKLKGIITDLQQKNDDLTAEEGPLTEEISSARVFIKQQEEVINALTADKKGLEDEVSSAHLKAKKHSEIITALQAAKTAFEEEVASNDSQIQRSKEMIVELQHSNEDLKTQQECLSEEVASAHIMTKQQEEVISMLNEKKKQNENEVSSIRIEANQHSEANAILNAAKAALEDEVKVTHAQIQNFQEIIQGLEKRNEDLKTERRCLTEEVSSAQERAEQQEKITRTLNEEKKVLENAILDARTGGSKQLEALASIQAAKTALEEEASSASAQIKRLKEMIKELLQRNEDLKTEEGRLSEKVAFAHLSAKQQEELLGASKLALENELCADRKKWAETEMEAKHREQMLQDEIERQKKQLQSQMKKFEETVTSKDTLLDQIQTQMEIQQRVHREEASLLLEEKKEECELLQAKIRFEKDSHSKEIDILQEELDHTKHLLEQQQSSRYGLPPPLEPLPVDVSMHSLDSLDDGELNLAELDTGSRASIASNASGDSIRSTDSARCKYTIEIHSRQATPVHESVTTSQMTTTHLSTSRRSITSNQLHLSSHSNLSDSLNLSHLGPLSVSRASSNGTDRGDNLPDKVSQTIDELQSNQSKTRKIRASMRQSLISRKTTGRGRFFIVNNCEEEPDVFDWNRLSELQRRNTLCLPHLQTSYPVETQTRPPQEISDDKLKVGVTMEGSGAEMMTRSMRKRKSGDLELPPGGGPSKMKTSNSYHAMPPPPPPDMNNTAKRSVSLQNMKSTAAGLPSSSSLHSKPQENSRGLTKNSSSSSISSSTSISSKASTHSTTSNSSRTTTTSSSNIRTERGGVLRASTKSNKKQGAVKTSTKAVKNDPRRDSIAFSIGFSPKPQVRRRSSRMSLSKKATNSPKVQAAAPGITPSKKSSRRRSIAKWLAK